MPRRLWTLEIDYQSAPPPSYAETFVVALVSGTGDPHTGVVEHWDASRYPGETIDDRMASVLNQILEQFGEHYGLENAEVTQTLFSSPDHRLLEISTTWP